jgi:hypothetical protein
VSDTRPQNKEPKEKKSNPLDGESKREELKKKGPANVQADACES